jgi:hypothetical protein
MPNRLVFLVAVAAVTFAAGGAPAQAQLHAQYYVLDAFGGVHAGGGAPLIVPATPYFGFDVTADLTYVPVGTASAVGDGLLVLDKWGGVHLGGALAADPPSGGTPYFGFDAARAIVFRDIVPRTVGSVSPLLPNFTSSATTFVSVVSATIFAPDDGFLLVAGGGTVQCDTNAGKARVRFSTNVDSTAGDPQILGGGGYAVDLNCAEGNLPAAHNSFQKLYPVSAGTHTAYVLYRHNAGSFTASFTLLNPFITVTYIDASATGASAPEPARPGIDPLRQ